MECGLLTVLNCDAADGEPLSTKRNPYFHAVLNFFAHRTKGVVHHLGKGKGCRSNIHLLFVSEVCISFNQL